MADKKSDGSIEQLTKAVADRMGASARAARLPGATRAGSPSLLDRLASAVGQRLASRSGTNIDLLASAVAHRLAASETAVRLASGAARHFAHELVWPEPQLDRLVVETSAQLKPAKS